MIESMSPRAVSFLFLLAAIGINLTGETVLKSGLNRIGEIQLTPVGLYRVFTTPAIILGFGLVFGAAVVWLKVISVQPLSWAYPMLALGYLPLQFSSHKFLGEDLSVQRLIGVAVVIVGVALVFRS